MTRAQHSAIVLTSGGLDSTTCLAIARSEGFAPLYSLTFNYGQRHQYELAAAQHIAERMGAHEHRVIQIDLRQFGHSALTDDIAVPKDHAGATIGQSIPITYVPARNTIFLSYALAWGEVLNCTDIFIGVNSVDYSGYPDCRPTFIHAFETMANLGTQLGTESTRRYRIHAPLINLSKAQIIQRGAALGVDYSTTFSCYDPEPGGLACGHCDACLLRRHGFLEAGMDDPTRYADWPSGL